MLAFAEETMIDNNGNFMPMNRKVNTHEVLNVHLPVYSNNISNLKMFTIQVLSMNTL